MKLFSIATILLLSSPAWADTPLPKKLVDFSKCNPPQMMGAIYPWSISESGGLRVDTQDDNVTNFQRGDKVDSVTYKMPYWNMGQSGKNYITYKVSLHKGEKGPTHIDTDMEFDKEYLDMMKQWSPEFKMAKKGTSLFDYDASGNCFVKQSYMEYDTGKRDVVYDQAMCSELVRAAKKASMKKLMQCKADFANLNSILAKHEGRLEKEGKEIALGMMGSPMQIKAAKQEDFWKDHEFAIMNLVGMCNMNAAMYGNSAMDPELGMSWGMVPNKGPYSAGGGFGSGFDTKTEEEPVNPAK